MTIIITVVHMDTRGPRGGIIPKPRQVTIEPGDKPMPSTLTVVGVGDVILPDSRQVRGD